MVLDLSEVEALIAVTKILKHKAILMLTYSSGLRVNETARLKLTDIDSKRMTVKVSDGKGGKDRNAMLSPQLLERLRLWWREGKRRGVMFPHGWLFPGRSYTDPISSRQLHRAVKEAAEVAGIKRRISPHTLRHSYATHLLEEGISIRLISAYLGHTSLETTLIYTHLTAVNEAGARAAIARLLPPDDLAPPAAPVPTRR